MSKTNPARGMRDLLPAEVRKRNYVIAIIKEVYESYGFEPLETPAIENIETLTGKYGEEGNQLIFKILKRGDKLTQSLESRVSSPEQETSSNSRLADLALRYDLTVPLARVVANNRNDLPKFFKRYQIQPVWRADRPGRGRYREFYQCDVDAIGSGSMVVEAELIAAVSEILTRLGFDDFVIRLNHRELLTKMVEEAGIESSEEAFIALDKLDKIGIDSVRKELIERGIDESAADAFLSLIDSEIAHPELDTILALCPDAAVKIDRTLARGLSYYTGAIFEINVPDLAGSLGGGGRYDGLIGMFGKEQIPACGFSLGLERILVVMDERGMFPPEIAGSNAADVMVAIDSEETIAESLHIGSELRKKGLRVLVYPEADKLGKQFKYADSINIRYVCVPGEGSMKLKNMTTGDQNELSIDDIARSIRSE